MEGYRCDAMSRPVANASPKDSPIPGGGSDGSSDSEEDALTEYAKMLEEIP